MSTSLNYKVESKPEQCQFGQLVTSIGLMDMENILEVIDTLDNANYTFLVEDDDDNPFTFTNLVIKKRVDDSIDSPYLLDYILDSAYIDDFIASDFSLQHFTGTMRKRFLANFSPTNRNQANLEIRSGTDTREPCDYDVRYTNGTSTSGSNPNGGGGGDAYSPGSSTTSGGYLECTTYWDPVTTTDCRRADIGDGPRCTSSTTHVLRQECFWVYPQQTANDGSTCPDPETEDVGVILPADIILMDSFRENAKAMCVYKKLSTTNIMSRYLSRFDADFTQKDLQWHVVTSLPDYINGKTSAGLKGFYKIEINGNNLANRSIVNVARTMMHELIHAELARKVHSVGGTVDPNDFPGIFDYYTRFVLNWQHQQMAAHFTSIIGEALWEFDDKRKGLQYYKDLAWSGLRKTIDHNNPGTVDNPNLIETVAWQDLPDSDKTRILANIENEKQNGNKSCTD